MSLNPTGYIILFGLSLLVFGIALLLIMMLKRQGPSVAQATDRSTIAIRVLVVESVPQARAMLVKFLRLQSSVIIVGEAATGQAAIWQAGQLQPTVILLDLTLPDMDGLTVAKTIAQTLPTMRFVLTRETATPEPTELPLGLSAPLVKPLNYQGLMEALHQARRLV